MSPVATRRFLFLAALAGCGGPTSSAPSPATSAAAPAAPSPAVADAAPSAIDWPALVSAEPADDAPVELAQFGQLVGVWRCQSESRQPDGSFAASPGRSTWTWFYSLGGRAVQDIFEPVAGPVGTNLRLYDSSTGSWEIQWATGTSTRFEHITARAVDGSIVMRGEVPDSQRFPAHARKITFFDISDHSFGWRYEAAAPGATEGWREHSRMQCERASADPGRRAGSPR